MGHKRGTWWSLPVDLISMLFLIIAFSVFGIIFRSTVEPRAEFIRGVVIDADSERTIISLLGAEFDNSPLSDRIVAFCNSEDELGSVQESLKSKRLPFVIDIICPDGKEFALSDRACEDTDDLQIVGISPGKPITLRYCQEIGPLRIMTM